MKNNLVSIEKKRKNKLVSYLKNEQGEISTVGKIAIGCIVILFMITVTKFTLDWANNKVTDTTQKVDTEYGKWGN